MYKDLISDKKLYSLDIPNTIVPTPDKFDYESGFIQRYIVQKANDINGFVYEVNLNTYQELSENPYWLTYGMRWRITGPIDPIYKVDGTLDDMGVRTSNRASIGLASNVIKNTGLYFPNILQFHK
jgi:hypothetical protein